MRVVGAAPSWPRELKGTLGWIYGVIGTMLKGLSPFSRVGFSRQDFWEQNAMIHLCRNLKGSLYLERCIAFLKPLLHQDGELQCRKIQGVVRRGWGGRHPSGPQALCSKGSYKLSLYSFCSIPGFWIYFGLREHSEGMGRESA